MSKVHLAKGMRDLLPHQMIHRQRVISTIQEVFTRYGFEPMETPAMERIETLTGKYGDEGDKLIFKVLKRGAGEARGECDQALRYDLTVPLARVVAMNPGLPMPFKRSQIQPVWRADRPQRGRFREFYQCDVDTVGAPCGLADAECLAVFHDCMVALGFDRFVIRVNDRRLLAALAAAIGAADRELAMITAIDKLDKIGREGVNGELRKRDFSEAQIAALWGYLDGDPVPGAEEAEETLDEVIGLAHALGVSPERIRRDRTLARGLDYYTGPVFETELIGAGMGSVGGGGRYDGLIGMFSGRQIPAVGISLGLERLFVIMEERGMVPPSTTTTRVWVTVFSDETRDASLAAVTALRAAGIPAQISLTAGKLGKQIKAAHKRGVRFVVVIGPDERAADRLLLKDMHSGDQALLSLDEVIARTASDG
ncbi:MAG: histidine--tRNA ligase [Deltaproteobacteria bacterium]|nr:MAG: histidine--tRNA ligase [Deltaproteobacteria bacterium]